MRNGRVNRLIGETGKIVMSVNRIKTIIETFLGSDMPGEVQQRFAEWLRDPASRSRVSTRNYSQWMGGSLSFDDTSLADILTNLERWYAVEIDAPEAWTRQVRMSFKLIRNESIEEILKAMSLVVEMDYVCAGRRITIIPKQPKNS